MTDVRSRRLMNKHNQRERPPQHIKLTTAAAPISGNNLPKFVFMFCFHFLFPIVVSSLSILLQLRDSGNWKVSPRSGSICAQNQSTTSSSVLPNRVSANSQFYGMQSKCEMLYKKEIVATSCRKKIKIKDNRKITKLLPIFFAKTAYLNYSWYYITIKTVYKKSLIYYIFIHIITILFINLLCGSLNNSE